MTFVLLLAAIAGVAGGVGAVVFRLMINAIQTLFFSDLLPYVTIFAWRLNLGIILLPALGAAIIAPVVYHLAPETRGTGIPEIMDAYTEKQGRIRTRVAILKIVVSAITIGSGGSAGREGPITQIGGASGSAIGRALRLNEDQVKLLLVSGVAAGIAGTFNAPLGGALFSIEVLQRGFSWRGTPSIIVASVVGAAVASLAFGVQPVLSAPSLGVLSALQLVPYVVLGLAFGLLSYLWAKVFYLFQDAFNRISMAGTLKLVIGGASVGVLGMLAPSYGILGVGYQGIDLVLAGGVTLGLALALGVAKVLATSLTIGSGGSGGIFAPTLYAGAMFGGAFGALFANLVPGLTTQTVGYSLSGMGALIAGSARAPLTAIVIVPEMTGDWNVLPAMMISCITSYYVSSYLLKHSSIYTLKLEKRGVDIRRLSVPDYLNLVAVGEVMEKVDPVALDATVASLVSRKEEFAYPRLAVIHADSTIAGYVEFDRAQAVPPELRETTLVSAITNPDVPVVSAQESVPEALRTMEERGAYELFVADGTAAGPYAGIFSANSLVKAHEVGTERSED
ncbi:MAG: chloride channel protein [Thaumarchaeota archaeon]|nr:chloride channel protein [Nitrososphaerota archaeon]